jgi:hypothetical protein
MRSCKLPLARFAALFLLICPPHLPATEIPAESPDDPWRSSTQMAAAAQALVAEYARNAEFDAADAQLEAIAAAGWDKLWFSWRGPVDPQGRFY